MGKLNWGIKGYGGKRFKKKETRTKNKQKQCFFCFKKKEENME